MAKHCPNEPSCELFPLISRPGFLRVWQINYCEADHTRCERFRLHSIGQPVSPTLLPNGHSLPALAVAKKAQVG